MSDLIDRQRLLERFDETDGLIYSGMTIKEFCKALVEEMPSAQQWIPCSERLPEPNSRCLITTTFGGQPYIDIDDYYSYGWDDWKDKVIAWQSLPEPWKGDEA